MAFKQHWLMQWGGTLGTQGEIWSNTLRFASDADGGGNLDPVAELPRLADAINALIAGSSSNFADFVRCTFVKLNEIGTDGKYLSGTESNTRVYSTPATPRGTQSSNYHPYSVAAVISTRTEFARGRGSRGRIFSPGPALAVQQTGRIDVGQAAQLAGVYATFISSCNDFLTPLSGLRACVLSSINGAANPITGVDVGDVLDTMRSRRNALTESRSFAAVS